MNGHLLFYLPWISVVLLADIFISLNFSKIPVAKTFYGTSFLNGSNLTILTIIFLVFVAVFLYFSKIPKLLNRKTFLYIFGYLVIISLVAIFFTKTADVKIIEKAEQLKTVSIIQEIVRKKSPALESWQVGDALTVAFVSESFGIPTGKAYGILHAIFSVSAPLLLFAILSRFAGFLDSSRRISILLFLYLLVKYADLKLVLLSGLSLLAVNLLLDYRPLIRSKNKKIIYFEEIQLALLLIYFASLNLLAFKIGIILALIFAAFTKRLRPLIILLLTLLINPLLIGLVLRF